MGDNFINALNKKKILIIGLGLIGGSIAKALNKKLNVENITALDPDENSIRHALGDGIIREGFTSPKDSLWQSDLVFLCTQIKLSKKYFDIISTKVPSKNILITDVCSTKTEIVRYANSINNAPAFIGGHPMAGSEKGGYRESSAHLFENAYYVLTPTDNSGIENLNLMIELVRGIGGIPVILEPEEHDFITAGISHVPHIIASALVNLVMENETKEGKLQMLAAGGFKDITRIASSSPEMWENIVSSNSEQITKILSHYIFILENLKKDISQSNERSILEFFKSAKTFRDSVPARIKGLIEPLEEIQVDVVDEPGIIGKIATLLGENGINIKNINVSNNREFEQGCLTISLPDRNMANKAFTLLSTAGYLVYKK